MVKEIFYSFIKYSNFLTVKKYMAIFFWFHLAEGTKWAGHRVVVADSVVCGKDMVIYLYLEEFLSVCEEGFVWQSPYLGPEL